jgi:hypothetical protein
MSSDSSEPFDPFFCRPFRNVAREDLTCTDFCTSKREYLLAQIRQKDQIIESLLKQVCQQIVILASFDR